MHMESCNHGHRTRDGHARDSSDMCNMNGPSTWAGPVACAGPAWAYVRQPLQRIRGRRPLDRWRVHGPRRGDCLTPDIR